MNKLKTSLLLVSLLISTYIAADTNKTVLPVLEVSFNPAGTIGIVPDEYVSGNMKLTDADGSVVEMNAKFKTRGATASEYSMKPSFNMKLRDENGAEKDSSLLGIRSMSSWILDAMAIDRICMRNRVAFDLWNDFSKLPYETKFDSRNGTVGKFVEVYINKEYLGIYCMSDRINRKLLDLKKPDLGEDSSSVTIRGVLYKHGTNDFIHTNIDSFKFSADSTAHVIEYHDAWELVEPEKYASIAWDALHELYANSEDSLWIKDHFYLEQLADYQVFITALCIEDNWGTKNAFISARNVTADGDKKRFIYTPWDLDTALGGSYNGQLFNGNYSVWQPIDIERSTMPVPFGICNQMPEFKTMLRNSWIKGRKGAFSVDSVRSKLYFYRDQLINSGAWERSCAHWNSKKYTPCFVDDLSKEIDLIIKWYEERFKKLDEYYNVKGDVSVDNISADAAEENNTIYNLKGIKVTDLQKGNIYIQGGKKIIVK